MTGLRAGLAETPSDEPLTAESRLRSRRLVNSKHGQVSYTRQRRRSDPWLHSRRKMSTRADQAPVSKHQSLSSAISQSTSPSHDAMTMVRLGFHPPSYSRPRPRTISMID